MPAANDALDALPPWDAAPYFQQVTEGSVTPGLNQGVLLVGADPNRIALVVHTAGVSVLTISLKSSTSITSGLTTQAASPPIVLLFSTTGPLCQQAWYISGSFGGTATYYAVSLYRWPQLRPAVKRAKRASTARPKKRDRDQR